MTAVSEGCAVLIIFQCNFRVTLLAVFAQMLMTEITKDFRGLGEN